MLLPEYVTGIEVLVDDVLYSAALPKLSDFERNVNPLPWEMELSNGVGLTLFTSKKVSMNAAQTMSPDVGAAESVKVSWLPVAAVLSVPVPPIDDVLQF